MTQNDLHAFIDDVCGQDRLRIEADLGDGFVRLRSSEADRRQAAQDIRCSEDVLLELLRNAFDAQAHHVYVATQRSGDDRLMVVIDDGCGIPAHLFHHIFEPRVTSKLDTAHPDKWGFHGRGMALYSIAQNTTSASVVQSVVGSGTSLEVHINLSSLSEKADQSTFPHFEKDGSSYGMRGPKNLLRTACEFVLEYHRECEVYFGSPSEIASAMYRNALEDVPPIMRAFGEVDESTAALMSGLALAHDADDFTRRCRNLGLILSPRTSRRILDGTIQPPPSLLDRMSLESFPHPKTRGKESSTMGDNRGLRLSAEDKDELKTALVKAIEPLQERYFIEALGEPSISTSGDAIRITIPILKQS